MGEKNKGHLSKLSSHHRIAEEMTVVGGKEDTTKFILLHPAEVGGLFASNLLNHYAEHPSLWLVTFQI